MCVGMIAGTEPWGSRGFGCVGRVMRVLRWLVGACGITKSWAHDPNRRPNATPIRGRGLVVPGGMTTPNNWTRCRRCGRHLSDPESIRLQRGPECRTQTDPSAREEMTLHVDYVLDHIADLPAPDRQPAYAAARDACARLETGKRVPPRLQASLRYWHAKLAAPAARASHESAYLAEAQAILKGGA